MATTTAGYKANAFEGRNLAFFFLMAFGLSWLSAALTIFGVRSRVSALADPGLRLVGSVILLVVMMLGAFGPSLAAFIMTALTEGKPGVRALWRRFWNRNLSRNWLLVVLLILPALQLGANAAVSVAAGPSYLFRGWPNAPGQFLGQFVTMFIFAGLAEEFGWRGYALPRFQAGWDALKASIVLGVIWAGWHIPNFFYSGSAQYGTGFVGFAIVVIGLSILLTWIFNNTNGSVLAAALFHAMWNTWVDLTTSVVARSLLYAVVLVAIVLIVIAFGRRTLVQPRPPEALAPPRPVPAPARPLRIRTPQPTARGMQPRGASLICYGAPQRPQLRVPRHFQPRFPNGFQPRIRAGLRRG